MTVRAGRILDIVRTDKTFRPVEGGFVGKCIHCNTRLQVTDDGTLVGKASVEHIVPRAHGGGDDIENLALACVSCNNEKGRRHDVRGPGDPGYEKVVGLLKQRRAARWRPLP